MRVAADIGGKVAGVAVSVCDDAGSAGPDATAGAERSRALLAREAEGV